MLSKTIKLLLFLMTLFSLKTFAQGTITGIVKDSYGERLPGVNVIQKKHS